MITRSWERIKRFIRWFPVIWHIHEWDPTYLHMVMLRQITDMRDAMKAHGHHLGQEKDIKDMSIVIELLTRLVERTDYSHPMLDKLMDNWEPEWVLINGQEDDDDALYEMKDNHTKSEKRLVGRLLKQSSKVDDEQFKYLMTLLNKHRRWWY